MPERITLEPDDIQILERGKYFNYERKVQVIRFLTARAAFLDRLLHDDEVIDPVVQAMNDISGARDLVASLEGGFQRVREIGIAGGILSANGMSAAAHGPEDLPPDQQALLGEINDDVARNIDDLRRLVRGERVDSTREILRSASGWACENGVYWPWLVADLVGWYFNKVMYMSVQGGWSGVLQRDPSQWRFSHVDDADLVPELHITRAEGETGSDYATRAQGECADFLKTLKDPAADTTVLTDTDVSSVKRNVGWLYDHRFLEVPIRELARDFIKRYSDLAPEDAAAQVDGRRKDVRDGIRSANEILGSTGVIFSRTPTISATNAR